MDTRRRELDLTSRLNELLVSICDEEKRLRRIIQEVKERCEAGAVLLLRRTPASPSGYRVFVYDGKLSLSPSGTDKIWLESRRIRRPTMIDSTLLVPIWLYPTIDSNFKDPPAVLVLVAKNGRLEDDGLLAGRHKVDAVLATALRELDQSRLLGALRRLSKGLARPHVSTDLCYRAIDEIGKFAAFDHSCSFYLCGPNGRWLELVAEKAEWQRGPDGRIPRNPNIGCRFDLNFNLVEALGPDTCDAYVSCATAENEASGELNLEIQTFHYEGNVQRLESGLRAGVREIVGNVIRNTVYRGSALRPKGSFVRLLHIGPELVAVFVMSHLETPVYEPIELAAVSRLTEVVAPSIYRDWLAHKELADLASLIDIDADASAPTAPFGTLLGSIVSTANSVLQSDVAVLIPYDATRGQFDLDLLSVAGASREDFHEAEPSHRGVVSTILRAGELEWMDPKKYGGNGSLTFGPNSFVSKHGITSFYAVALWEPSTKRNTERQPLGILFIDYKKRQWQQGRFPEATRSWVKLLGERAAQVIARYRMDQTRIRQLAAVLRVSTSINQVSSVADVLKVIFDEATKLVGADAGGVVVPDHRSGDLVLVHGLGIDPARKFRHIRYGEGVVGFVAKTREPVVVHDLEDPSTWPTGLRPLPWIKGARSEMALPLLITDDRTGSSRLLAVLDVEVKRRPRAFVEDDLNLFRTLGNEAVLAIRRVEDFAWLNTTLEIGRQVITYDSEDEIFRSLLEGAMGLTGSYAASARSIDATGQFLRPIVHMGVRGRWKAKLIALGKGTNGWAARHRGTCYLADVTDRETNMRKYPGMEYISSRRETRSCLSVPLKYIGEVLGVINLEHKEENGLEHYVKNVEGLANQAAVVLHRARQRERELRAKDHDAIVAFALYGASIRHEVLKLFRDILEDAQHVVIDPKKVESIALRAQEGLKWTERLASYLPSRRFDPDTSALTSECSVYALLDDALKRVEKKKQPVLVNKMRPNKDITVRSERAILEWVLDKILENAARYIPGDGTGRMTVSSSVEHKEWVIISISNNGCPIDTPHLEQIFAYDKASLKPDGAGLAMPTARAIVVGFLGGYLWAENTVKGEPVFHLKIPRKVQVNHEG